MAKIQLTAFASQITGSVAGTTFQRTRYGLCAQNKVNQKFRRSNSQSQIRQGFLQIAGAWRNLTEAQRQTWIDAAGSRDTAYSLFQSKNYARVLFSFPILNNYPGTTPQTVLSFDSASIVFDVSSQLYHIVAQYFVMSSPVLGINRRSFQVSVVFSPGAVPNPRERTTIENASLSISGNVLEVNWYGSWPSDGAIQAYAQLYHIETGDKIINISTPVLQIPSAFPYQLIFNTDSIAWNASLQTYVVNLNYLVSPTLPSTAVTLITQVFVCTSPPCNPDPDDYTDPIQIGTSATPTQVAGSFFMSAFPGLPTPPAHSLLYFRTWLILNATSERISNVIEQQLEAPEKQ